MKLIRIDDIEMQDMFPRRHTVLHVLSDYRPATPGQAGLS